MIQVQPVTLDGFGVRLEPLAPGHHDGLAAAAADGENWKLWFTSVPAPEQTEAYIAEALAGQRDGVMLPWAVREVTTGAIVGTTFKRDGYIWNDVDQERVKAFMQKARAVRKRLEG